MDWNQTAWMALYYGALALLCCYGLHRYFLLFLYYKHKRHSPPPSARFEALPPLTVQLPIYNEMCVVERLILAVCRLDYPRDRLQIQVLDDSTDETRAICARLVACWRAKGFDIHHVTRPVRSGYKAGALANGLRTATGDFIAIFDADFLPEPDLLQRLVHYFTDPQVGMVQSRWGHLNADHSLLTRVQAMLLDGHFLIEQTARCRSGRLFNFNGTAGIWRRECIESAGGWSGDTLAEDLDLSYRAQLRGWKFLYLPEVVTAAELPVDISGFKTQQHRWAKGSVQACLKLLPALWRSPMPFTIKLEGTVHLTANLAYLPLMTLFLLLNPTLRHAPSLNWKWMLAVDFPIFLLACASIMLFYVCAQRELHRDWKRRLWLVPVLMALGIGMSLNNARAVVEALCRHQSGFTRTPKYGLGNSAAGWREQRDRAFKQASPWLELACGFYMTCFLLLALQRGNWGIVPFMLMFQAGFSYVAVLSLAERLPIKEPKPAEAKVFSPLRA